MKQLKKNRELHGMSRTNIYRYWNKYFNACTNPNSRPYTNYGARGITFYWNEFTDFYDFIKKIGFLDENQTFKRLDKNKSFTPDNIIIVDKQKNVKARNEKIYQTWGNIKTKCYNPYAVGYELYGGLGIRMCNEWLYSPAKFIDWAENNGWVDSDSGIEKSFIRRFNKRQDFSPENCFWAKKKESTIWGSKKKRRLLKNDDLHKM